MTTAQLIIALAYGNAIGTIALRIFRIWRVRGDRSPEANDARNDAKWDCLPAVLTAFAAFAAQQPWAVDLINGLLALTS